MYAAERDDIHEKFSTSILELQQKSTLKYLVLEKKITTLRHELDVRDAQLHALADKDHDTDTGMCAHRTFHYNRADLVDLPLKEESELRACAMILTLRSSTIVVLLNSEVS